MRSRTVTVNCQAKCDSTRVTQVGRNLWRCAAGAKKFGDLCAHMRVVAEDARADCFFWIAQRKSPKIALAQPSLALHLAIPRKFRMFWTWEVAFQILKALLACKYCPREPRHEHTRRGVAPHRPGYRPKRRPFVCAVAHCLRFHRPGVQGTMPDRCRARRRRPAQHRICRRCAPD